MLKLAMGSALLLTATQVVAVSLGATQGSVIIGRPLDLLVQSSITAADASAGLCLNAEVLYGDTRIAPTAITTAIDQIGAEGRGRIRITVDQPVNEPIVTLVLRAGCTTTFRRSYTLLADVEPALAAAAVAAAAPLRLTPAPIRPAAPVASAPTTLVTPGSGVAGRPSQAAIEALGPETPIVLAAPAPRPAAVTRMASKTLPLPTVSPAETGPQGMREAAGTVVAAAPPPPAGPRLQLDPVDLSVVAPAPGGETGEASGPVVIGPEVAAGALEALQQQQNLQQEVEALRAEQERMRLAIETLNAQLAEAQRQSGQAASRTELWTYGLPALGLLLLGGVWYLLRSRRRPEEPTPEKATVPWWESALPDVPPANEPSPSAQPVSRPPLPQPAAVVAAAPAWSDDLAKGLEVAEGRESMFREVPIMPLELERLQDLWQRVEFFRSIGQLRDALEALKAFVTEGTRSSEGPYLLWLHLAYGEGTDSDRQQAASFYETHYQRIAPSAQAVEAPLGLADDPGFIQALIRDWPTEAARDTLMQALASQPGDNQSPLGVRTLAAFDDLVMLVGLLDTLETMPLEPAPSKVGLAATDPLDELEAEFPAWQSVPDSPKPAASAAPAAKTNNIDFDFDMFELEPKEVKPKPADPADPTPPKS